MTTTMEHVNTLADGGSLLVAQGAELASNSGGDVYALTSGHDPLSFIAAQEITAEYTNAGVSFDDLANSNAQEITRKIGWAIVLWQLVSLIFAGLSSRGAMGGPMGAYAGGYGGGGAFAMKLISTIVAVTFLTDLKVVPPTVDLLQEFFVGIFNFLFKGIGDFTGTGGGSGSSYSY